jgi:hypothetical protein
VDPGVPSRRDPDTGTWISDAEVAEIRYTAFVFTPMGSPPGWSCAASRTPAADITHRRQAIIETVFADQHGHPPRAAQPAGDGVSD